jgi:hypothetical protein|tara:strand:- start:400 stop:507 length:108 start_codon:yes stop_codon:yes gene_type:complete
MAGLPKKEGKEEQRTIQIDTVTRAIFKAERQTISI